MPTKNLGFSLIELLIAISIVCILAMAGLHVYSDHMIQARRLQAESILSELAIAMEEYQIAHGSYAQASILQLKIPAAVNQRYYQFMVESATDGDYVLAAVPRGVQAENDKCGVLRLKANGEREFCEK
jgi:type IV pilus assembly protein PilE